MKQESHAVAGKPHDTAVNFDAYSLVLDITQFAPLSQQDTKAKANPNQDRF